MDGNEKKWEDGNGTEEARAEEIQMEKMLRDLTDDVQVPPSLEPEAVEEMLLKRKREKKRKSGGRYWRKNAGIAAAACLCLAVGIVP